VNEWRAPGKKAITRAAVNQRQVVIGLTGGELVYFEMDAVRLAETWFTHPLDASLDRSIE
jgi:hypothetical protein